MIKLIDSFSIVAKDTTNWDRPKWFAWLNKSVDKERALTVNVKAEFVALRLTSLVSAEGLP